MLYEISRKVIKINKYEETNLSWNNNVLTVRGNKELHMLDFSYNLNSLQNGIDFKECTVSSSKTSPVSNDYLTKYVSRGVRNSELVEMVTNSAFWSHNKLLLKELNKVTAYQWSPFNLICENDSLLAAVNSVGNVEFFAPRSHGWYSVMDFSSRITLLHENIDKRREIPKNFAEVKETVYTLETSSICWASNLNKDNSAYFVTAQKSGDILFWEIKYHHANIEIEFCGSLQNSNHIEIVEMLWITIDKNKFFLVCSNEYGEIGLYECQIMEKQVTLLKTNNIWPYKDKMVVTYLHSHFYNDNILLIFNKHRHLVVQMYDPNFKLLFQDVQNVNDYKITSVAKYKDMFYLTTLNNKIYKIDFSITNETLEVSLKVIEIKELGSSYELYDIAVSPNSSLFALAVINRKLLPKKQTISIELVLLSPDIGCDTEITNIINNPTKKLTHMWDAIEVLRCKALKTKKLPEFNYGLLLKDDRDIYNLKVYLIILKIYNNLEKSMSFGLKEMFPQKSIDTIKEKILMVQALMQIENVYANYKRNAHLNGFYIECFVGCKNYLNYYCNKYNKQLSDYFTNDVLNSLNVNFKYQCQWCDEYLIGFSCTNEKRHVNMMCSHTFTPIEKDYLFCKSCNATARVELYDKNPICVFCDLYLINSDLIT